MKRNTPTRLELHRIRFNRDGCRGPFLNHDELSVAERQLLTEAVFTQLKIEKRKRDVYTVTADVFFSWGVMCPHPLQVRLYGGRERLRMPSSLYRWYSCSACGCSVKNEDYPSPRPAAKKA